MRHSFLHNFALGLLVLVPMLTAGPARLTTTSRCHLLDEALLTTAVRALYTWILLDIRFAIGINHSTPTSNTSTVVRAEPACRLRLRRFSSRRRSTQQRTYRAARRAASNQTINSIPLGRNLPSPILLNSRHAVPRAFPLFLRSTPSADPPATAASSRRLFVFLCGNSASSQHSTPAQPTSAFTASAPITPRRATAECLRLPITPRSTPSPPPPADIARRPCSPRIPPTPTCLLTYSLTYLLTYLPTRRAAADLAAPCSVAPSARRLHPWAPPPYSTAHAPRGDPTRPRTNHCTNHKNIRYRPNFSPKSPLASGLAFGLGVIGLSLTHSLTLRTRTHRPSTPSTTHQAPLRPMARPTPPPHHSIRWP